MSRTSRGAASCIAGPRPGRERPDRRGEPRLVGDHVARGARVEAAHRDHDRVEHVEPPGDQRLQRGHDLAGGRDRVGAPGAAATRARRGRGPSPPACRPPPSSVPSRLASIPSGSRPEATCSAERGDRAGPRPRPARPRRSSARPRRATSSPGWNMKITFPASSARRADSSRAAPASIAVCRSWPQACMTPSTLRGVRQAGALGHRQRVHVAAQQHGLARPAPAQHRGHRGQRPPRG